MIEAGGKKEVVREIISQPVDEFQHAPAHGTSKQKRIRQRLTDEAVERHRFVCLLVRFMFVWCPSEGQQPVKTSVPSLHPGRWCCYHATMMSLEMMKLGHDNEGSEPKTLSFSLLASWPLVVPFFLRCR